MPGKTLVHPARVGHLSMASLLDKQTATAASLQVDDRTLSEWWLAQLTWLDARCTVLARAMSHNLALLTAADDPRWPAYWLLDAKYRWTYEKLTTVTTRAHVVCCPNHGVEDLPRGVLDYEALALRSRLTGGDYWSYSCQQCAMGEIKRTAERIGREQPPGDATGLKGYRTP